MPELPTATAEDISNEQHPRTAKAARKIAKVATRAALYLFRFVWFAAIMCATFGTLAALASAAADVLPNFWPLRLVAFFVIAAAAIGVELLLIKGTRRLDNATNNRLFNMR